MCGLLCGEVCWTLESLAGIAGSNYAGSTDISLSLSLASVRAARCQVEVSATDRSLVQGSPKVYVYVCVCVS